MNNIPSIPQTNKLKLLNPNFEPLTAEKLRTFKGWENAPDERVNETVESIRQFAFILYETAANESLIKLNSIDNQLVVSLNQDIENQIPTIPNLATIKKAA